MENSEVQGKRPVAKSEGLRAKRRKSNSREGEPRNDTDFENFGCRFAVCGGVFVSAKFLKCGDVVE
jgi:hypothetical protein